MKIFCVEILIIFVTIFRLSQSISEQDKSLVRKLGKECKDKVNGVDEDIEALINREVLVTRSAKCVGACMMELFGIISNGTLIIEAAYDINKMTYNKQPETLKVVNEITDSCKDEKNDDKCELAAILMQCFVDEAKKRNFDYKNI